MEAYDQTPISVHKFVPIVSLGAEEDKGIGWGATVPDSKGNYYYTSFSPAQFVAPYAFIKLFHLPFSVLSLYIFNTLLFFLCWILTVILFLQIFKDRLRKGQIIFFTSLIYLFQTEIMHSQGITYWAQSLFQFLFLCQVLSYTRKDNKRYGFLFYLLCFINPYVEWTGFVANFGFMLLYFMERTDKKAKLKNIISVFSLTVLSGVAFCLHFLLVLPSDLFFSSLKDRFMARNITAKTSLLDVLKGYVNSYTYLLIVLLFMLIVCLCIKKARNTLVVNIKGDFRYWIIFAVPLLENIIMKEHAASYSFDRIKGIFLLLLIFFSVYDSLTRPKTGYFRRMVQISCPLLVLALSTWNLYNYVGRDNIYRWKVDYLKDNQMMETYINQRYNGQNSDMFSNNVVRGYMNTLFQRGIHEAVSDSNVAIDISKNKRYAVLLTVKPQQWQEDQLLCCKIIDNHSAVTKAISVQDGKIMENDSATIYQSNLSDQNWNNGISRNGAIVLFPNNPYNLQVIHKGGRYLASGNIQVSIQHVEYDSDWIRVICGAGSKLSAFAYPNVIEVVK